MEHLLPIIKVNACALLALPLLAISILTKLLQKALEKVMVFLGVGTAVLALGILHAIFDNPGGFFEGVGLFIALMILGGAIISTVVMVLFFFGGIAAAAVTAVVTICIGLLDAVFYLCHRGYSRLYDICKGDFQRIETAESGRNMRFTCVFWYLLTGLNKLIVFLFSLAFPISVLCAVGFLCYVTLRISYAVSTNFGIGILHYLQLFSGLDVVFSVLYVLVVVFSAIVVLISLGIEWGEWGQILKLSTQDHQSYWAAIAERTRNLNETAPLERTFAAGRATQVCRQSMEMLHGLFENLETLHQQVDAAIHVKQDSSLIYEFTSYIELLSQICKQLDHFVGQIPCDHFEHKLVPLIDTAKKKEKTLEREVFSILHHYACTAGKQQGAINFFAGCDSIEAVRKRYRSLCKVYHPDVGGHEETFQQLQAQYEIHTQADHVPPVDSHVKNCCDR